MSRMSNIDIMYQNGARDVKDFMREGLSLAQAEAAAQMVLTSCDEDDERGERK